MNQSSEQAENGRMELSVEHLAQPALARRPWYPRSFVVTDSVAGIERIFDDPVSVCIWRRRGDSRIQRYTQSALSTAALERAERIHVDRPNLDALLRGLPDAPGRDAFCDEVALLIDLVSTLSDSKWVGVRLLVSRGTPCPRFHVDKVDLRLICTWQGPGTEWLEHQAVDRRRLGQSANGLRDEESGLLRPGTQIHRMQSFDIGIFKGELWHGNAGRGAVHRSPRVEPTDPWRVMLSIEGAD